MEKARSSVMSEITDWIIEHPGASYYDFEAEAYTQKNEDWIAALKIRDTREFISEMLRSRRRLEKQPYNNPRYVSMQNAVEAKLKYEQEQREKWEE